MLIELNANDRHIIKRALKNRFEDLTRASERLIDEVPSVAEEFKDKAAETEIVLKLIVQKERELLNGTAENG